MATSQKAVAGVDPLKDLLGDVLARLEALEAQVGGGKGVSLGSSSSHHAPGPVKPSLHGKALHRHLSLNTV